MSGRLKPGLQRVHGFRGHGEHLFPFTPSRQKTHWT
jgi:hypothetical protein